MSSAPCLASTSASNFSSALRDVVSPGKNDALPPSDAMRSRRAFALLTSRPTSAMAAPALANPSAMEPHNSPVPPMTTATLPWSENNSEGGFIQLPLHPRARTFHQLFDFSLGRHRSIARRGHGQRTMRRAVVHGLLRVAAGHQAIHQTRRETVAAADAIENLEIGLLTALMELAVHPATGSPIVARGGLGGAQCRGDDLEVGECLDRRLNHFLKRLHINVQQVFVRAVHFKTEASGE